MSAGGKKQTVGYKYYLGAHIGLCHGPIDLISEIRIDDRQAWVGAATGGPVVVSAPELFGGEKREGGVTGTFDLEMGESNQLPNDYLQSQLGNDIPGYRGVTSVVLRQMYLGNNPYLKPWKFLASRVFTSTDGDQIWYSIKAGITRDGVAVDGTLSPLCEYSCDVISTFGAQNFDAFWPLDDPQRGALVPGTFAETGGGALAAGPNADADTGVGLAWGATTEHSKWIQSDFTNFGQGLALCDGAEYYQHNYDNSPREAMEVQGAIPDTFMDGGFYVTYFHANATSGADYVLEIDYNLSRGGFADVLINPRCTITQNTISEFFGMGLSLSGGNPTNQIDYTVEKGTHVVTIYMHQPEFEFVQNNGSSDSWRITHQYTVYVDGDGSMTQSISQLISVTVGAVPGVANIIRVNLFRGGNAAWLGMGYNKVNFVHADAWRAVQATFTDYSPDSEFFSANCIVGSCSDLNPAHIIRECLTDTNWGMGYTAADIDDTSFTAAADTLFSETMGISVVWEKEQAIETFVGEILRHIDAVLYVSRTTGKFVLKLIREEADSNTVLLDESNVSEVTDASRPTVSELTNSVTVIYWDPVSDEDAGVTVHNEALRTAQGVGISTTIRYPGFTSLGIANKVALRDLKALSTPLLSCSLTASRDAAELNIGDVFYLSWPDLEINNVLMRINEIDYGDGIDNSIGISAVQDVFSTPTVSVIEDAGSGWVDPLLAVPEPAVARVVEETPYYPLVLEVGELNANAILDDDPDAGFLLASGGRQGAEFNAGLYVDSGLGFEESNTIDFHPYATISSYVSKSDTVVYFESGTDIDLVNTGTIAQINSEMVSVESLVVDSNGIYTEAVIGRGILDTVPASHGIGSTIKFWGDFAVSDNEQYVAGESIEVKMRTVENSNILSEAEAPTDIVLMGSRAIRPYAPGNFRIDGLYYPESYVWSGSHTFTWAHRDRLQQTSGDLFDDTEGNIGPEAGTEYVVEGFAVVGDSVIDSDLPGADIEKFLEVNVGSNTEYVIDIDSGTFDSNYMPPPDGTTEVVLSVRSVRDGYSSYQKPEITLQFPGFTDSTGAVFDSVGAFDSVGVLDSVGAFDSVGVSDPSFSSVSLLLQMEGASFIDGSLNNHPVTANGGAVISSGSPKFGSNALFDGSSNLSIPDDTTLDLGTSDFTLEMWVYWPTGAANTAIMFEKGGQSISIFLGASSELALYCSSTGATWDIASDRRFVTGMTRDTWHHLAVTRSGTTFRTFYNGDTTTSFTSSAAIFSNSDSLAVGGKADLTVSFDGRIDDFRLTKGVARYTASFTPPTAPFPDQ